MRLDVPEMKRPEITVEIYEEVGEDTEAMSDNVTMTTIETGKSATMGLDYLIQW